MWVLGIETSCDETAAAVVSEKGEVRSDIVRSQVALHARYGGVVPELASRDHAKAIGPVVDEALRSANVTLHQLDGIAVTNRPGLSGALLVGLQMAKGLAWGADKPLVVVDHLIGHLLAVFLKRPSKTNELNEKPIEFPLIALLASGGHTAIYRVGGYRFEDICELGATRDDAAGEAFDKVAKLLGLGYPGGPAVDALAAKGDAERGQEICKLPSPMAQRDSLEFSFSGIKTAMARFVAGHEGKGKIEGQDLADICAAFQATVVHTMVSKTVRAARREKISRIVLAGGVAANRGLRTEMDRQCKRHGIELRIPPMASCTDNAAMIAYAGALRLHAGERDALSASPSTQTALLRVTRKGRGARI